MSGSIRRTFAIEDITPQELAGLFCDFFAEEQALFFAEVWTIGLTWSGAGWCQQSLAITEKLDTNGRNAITTLAAHLEPQS